MMLAAAAMLMAAAVLGSLAIVTGYVLGWANRAFSVTVDPRVAAVADALPGANCGGCGYVGCGEYAEAVAAGRAEVNLCGPGGEGSARALAGIMGVRLEASFAYRAVVHCAARRDQRLGRRDYRGEPTCAAANLVAGVQGCTYGCLGLGDCVRACPHGAIHVDDGLATVDYDKCVGCKRCAQACPRQIITMVPFKADRMLVVACSNKDFGPEVKEVCPLGCVGCKACSRLAEPMAMEGHLPVIDYERYASAEQFETAVAKCPRSSMIFVGKPTPDDLAAVADERLAEPIRPHFRTTVDETEARVAARKKTTLRCGCHGRLARPCRSGQGRASRPWHPSVICCAGSIIVAQRVPLLARRSHSSCRPRRRSTTSGWSAAWFRVSPGSSARLDRKSFLSASERREPAAPARSCRGRCR